MHVRAGGDIYSTATENMQTKSEKCQEMASSVQQNLSGVAGASSQVTIPSCPISSTAVLKETSPRG